MSTLSIYRDLQTQPATTITDFSAIENQLNTIGVQFERWTARHEVEPNAEPAAILNAYSDSIDRLKQQYGFQAVDVISLTPNHPDKTSLRQKFLAEHCHADFEVRFFIRGRGLFYLHVENHIYAVLCEQGDLISVPANTRHWFDMGENPDFSCIRLFTTPEGWVAEFSGSDIAKNYPTLEQYLTESP